MTVDSEHANYKFVYQNQQYLFCSQHCLDSFKQNPDKYLVPQSQNKPINLETAVQDDTAVSRFNALLNIHVLCILKS